MVAITSILITELAEETLPPSARERQGWPPVSRFTPTEAGRI
jgi:hypothetical protein